MIARAMLLRALGVLEDRRPGIEPICCATTTTEETVTVNFGNTPLGITGRLQEIER